MPSRGEVMKRIVILIMVFCFIALRGECDCVSKQSVKKEFYSNGKLKGEYQVLEKCKMEINVSITDKDGHHKYADQCQCDKVLDGKFTEFYENGKPKKEGFYQDGLLQMSFTEYSDKGAITRKGFFNQGKFVERGYTEVTNYVDGKLKEYKYYENEILREERVYQDGELVSEKIYDETGKLISNYDKSKLEDAKTN